MIIKEERRDLFTIPHGFYFAHCISNDFALGAGIAVMFDKLYDMKEKLNKFYIVDDLSNIGRALLIDNVFNLVTKNKHWDKPTYESLKETLEDMKVDLEYLNIKRLAIPKIGCGLDRLDWDIVKPIIEEVFNGSDLEIIVCYI